LTAAHYLPSRGRTICTICQTKQSIKAYCLLFVYFYTARPEIYTHNHYNIPTNHNVHINHIHIIHENIKMLALGTEAQPINKSIKITPHNMNTLCRYFRFPPAVTIGFVTSYFLSESAIKAQRQGHRKIRSRGKLFLKFPTHPHQLYVNNKFCSFFCCCYFIFQIQSFP
jgi:hypothetical protein